jgi:putative ABC transport system substrate-binding protein
MKQKILSLVLCFVVQMQLGFAGAQQAGKIPRIGYASGSGNANDPGPSVRAFRRGLQKLGYVEGKNILLEMRYSEGNNQRTPGLVAELVRLKVDVLVFHDPSAIRAGKQATKTIPIVMDNSGSGRERDGR